MTSAPAKTRWCMYVLNTDGMGYTVPLTIY